MSNNNQEQELEKVAREMWLVNIAAHQTPDLLEHYVNNIWPEIDGDVRDDYMRLAQWHLTQIKSLRESLDEILKTTEEFCPDCNYMRNANTICKCGMCSTSTNALRVQWQSLRTDRDKLQSELNQAVDTLKKAAADMDGEYNSESFDLVQETLAALQSSTTPNLVEENKRLKLIVEFIKESADCPTSELNQKLSKLIQDYETLTAKG